MDALSILKGACAATNKSKRVLMPIRSFTNLPPGEYIATNFEKVVTKDFGERLRLVVNSEFYMFLPNRFNEALTMEKVNELNLSPKIMVYGGKDNSRKDRLILDFKEPAYYVEQFVDPNDMNQYLNIN